MATAAANLVFQTTKWNPKCYPNRIRPLEPVKLRATLNQFQITELKSDSSSRLQYRPVEKLPSLVNYRPTEEEETCVNKVWRFVVKFTATVVLGGLLLLVYRPKPALAGRIRATSPPVEPAWSGFHEDEADSRFVAARRYNKTRSLVETWWFIISVFGLYHAGLAALHKMRQRPNGPDQSVLDFYNNRVPLLMGVILFAYIVWATNNNPSTILKLQLQVNLSNSGRALQTELNRIAETADTSTFKGVNSILRETTANIVKHPDCFISASTYVSFCAPRPLAKTILDETTVTAEYGRSDALNYLDQLSLKERVKLGEKLLTDVKNLKAESSTSEKSANEIEDDYVQVNANQLEITAESSTSQNSANEIQDEYMEVIILVALKGKHEFPTINSWDDLKEVVQLLTSLDPEDGIYPYGVEVLWSPKSSSTTGRKYLRWFK